VCVSSRRCDGDDRGRGGEVKVVLHCGNPNSAGDKGGAPVGNTNSSSREKNISNLFEEGCAFDRHSDDINALFSFRKLIEHEPLHAYSNLCSFLAHKLFQGDFITSGSSELRIVEGANQRRLDSSNFLLTVKMATLNYTLIISRK
jgi:hypothetical protein